MCRTFTASYFRIWNSSTGIPLPPLALLIVILSKTQWTSHSRMSGSRWVITSSWLSGSWRSFLYSSCVLLTPLFDIVYFCLAHTIVVLYCAHLCMKCSLGISNFLEEISSMSILLLPSISLHCSHKKAFFSLLAILRKYAFSWIHLSLSPLPFASFLFSAMLGFLRQPLCLLAFLFLGDGFGHILLYNVTNFCP